MTYLTFNSLLFPLFTLITVAVSLFVVTVQGQSYNSYTWAGTGIWGTSNGFRTSASFAQPTRMAKDSLGNFFVTDSSGGSIKKITPTGQVSTFVSISNPQGITIDPSNNLYAAERSGGNNIRKVSPAGVISILAGSSLTGYLDGAASSAKFNNPVDLAIDALGNIYVADMSSNAIRLISPDLTVSTFAGNGACGSANVDAVGTSATFCGPQGINFDRNRNLYVADGVRGLVRVITPSRAVSTIAGSGVAATIDGFGTYAAFNNPVGIAVDSNGNIFVSEWETHYIRKISPKLEVKTILGSGSAGNADAAGTYASFTRPFGIFIDLFDHFFVLNANANTIKRIVTCPTNSNYSPVTEGCTCPYGVCITGYASCSEGTEVDSFKNICKICSLGTFRNSTMTSCSYCPLGQEPSTDKTSCNSCSLGKYRNVSASAACFDCPVGTESSANFQSCGSCSSGKYRPSILYSQCIDCPLLATCSGSAISSCQSGYKINAAKTACEQCPIGTQSSGDYLSCVSCTVGTNYRSSLTQSTCQSCPSNAQCPTAASFTCNAGYEPTLDGGGCSQCQEGFSKAAAGNSACSQCSIGTESANNKQLCTACGTGKYRPNTIVNKCIPCPPNGICNASTLQKCVNGWKINSVGDGCEQCPIGQESDGLTCVNCQTGYLKPSQSFSTCIPCPQGYSSCGISLITCQDGSYFDTNAQCKHNDTYFALQQTGTASGITVTNYVTVTQTTVSVSTSTSVSVSISTSTSSIYATVIQSSTQTVTQGYLSTAISTIVSATNTNIVQTQIATVTQFQTVSGSIQPQAQAANSVSIDLIGITLPISPLIFAAAAFGAGMFIMLILSLICCRRSPSRRKDDDFDAGMTGLTTTTNSKSQITYTNATSTLV